MVISGVLRIMRDGEAELFSGCEDSGRVLSEGLGSKLKPFRPSAEIPLLAELVQGIESLDKGSRRPRSTIALDKPSQGGGVEPALHKGADFNVSLVSRQLEAVSHRETVQAPSRIETFVRCNTCCS